MGGARATRAALQAPPPETLQGEFAVVRNAAPFAPATQSRVLLVDADRVTLEGLGERFAAEQFDVAVAQSGLAALRIAETLAIHAAIVNLGLPDISGLDVLAGFRARGLRIPVVIVAAAPTLQGIALAMGLGASDVLEEPLDGDHVVRLVRRLVSDRRR